MRRRDNSAVGRDQSSASHLVSGRHERDTTSSIPIGEFEPAHGLNLSSESITSHVTSPDQVPRSIETTIHPG